MHGANLSQEVVLHHLSEAIETLESDGGICIIPFRLIDFKISK